MKHSLAVPLSACPIALQVREVTASRASHTARAMHAIPSHCAATTPLLRLTAAALALAALAAPVRADDETARNWANDPFLQLRADDPGCPEPRGPRMTAVEWRAEAHWRIETGTSCWLAGRCADANAYRYDAAIAQALFPRLQALPELAGSGLWAYFPAVPATLKCTARSPVVEPERVKTN